MCAEERWAEQAPADESCRPGAWPRSGGNSDELGAPNPFAVEEYAAIRSRLEALEAQRRDLDRAIDRTRALINELDTLIASQFRATFSALEAAFDRRFRQLFGGGYARLSLTDPADLAATGVDITARPPGKKAQALAMLSGGERALTAVALLFAMLEVRPVPFCVLDEVDAALDEANVGRFVEALQGLAVSTQFIVITHNRGTIEAADALFGVTVGEDAVSHVISLRLDEATAIAERAAGERERACPLPRRPAEKRDDPCSGDGDLPNRIGTTARPRGRTPGPRHRPRPRKHPRRPTSSSRQGNACPPRTSRSRETVSPPARSRRAMMPFHAGTRRRPKPARRATAMVSPRGSSAAAAASWPGSRGCWAGATPMPRRGRPWRRP